MGNDAGMESLPPKAKKRKLQSGAKNAIAKTPESEGVAKATSGKAKRKKAAATPSEDPPVESGMTESKQGKKRKRVEMDSDANTASAPAQETSESGARRKTKKRKKKLEVGEEKQATGDEDKRKAAQREIQQLVVKLRAEGKSKHEVEAAKRALKQKYGGTLQQPESRKTKKVEAWKQKIATEEGHKELEDKRKKGLEHKHDVVVIPVIWRGRHDHQAIMAAAEDVKALLAQQEIDVWVDSRRHYTPGQKFAHWEYRGVMLRVEIGPEDFKSGMLQVCRAKAPGEYKSVEKKKVRLPPAGTRGLLLTLKEWGLAKIDIERREGDSAEEEEPEVQSKDDKASGKAEDPEDDLGGNWAPRAAPAKEKKKGVKKKR